MSWSQFTWIHYLQKQIIFLRCNILMLVGRALSSLLSRFKDLDLLSVMTPLSLSNALWITFYKENYAKQKKRLEWSLVWYWIWLVAVSIATSSWRSSHSPFGSSTGGGVIGHYFEYYFLFSKPLPPLFPVSPPSSHRGSAWIKLTSAPGAARLVFLSSDNCKRCLRRISW